MLENALLDIKVVPEGKLLYIAVYINNVRVPLTDGLAQVRLTRGNSYQFQYEFEGSKNSSIEVTVTDDGGNVLLTIPRANTKLQVGTHDIGQYEFTLPAAALGQRKLTSQASLSSFSFRQGTNSAISAPIPAAGAAKRSRAPVGAKTAALSKSKGSAGRKGPKS